MKRPNGIFLAIKFNNNRIALVALAIPDTNAFITKIHPMLKMYNINNVKLARYCTSGVP